MTSVMGRSFGYRTEDLPVTEDVAGRLVRLPIYHEMTEAEQQRVIDGVTEFLDYPGFHQIFFYGET